MVTSIPWAGCATSLVVAITTFSLGNIFSAYLYGALTVQLYRYYISFPKDSKLFKVVIYIVYITETICTVLLIYELRTLIAMGTSDFWFMIICSRIPLIVAVCGGIVAFLTQSMYAYRIQIITKWKYTSWVVILVMALQVAVIGITPVFTEAFLRLFAFVWASISLLVDVTITSIMIRVLKKDEIYSKQFKRKIARLIYLLIGTGFLTAATNVCVLVLSFNTSPHALGLLMVLSKLYANSMMVLVNSRIPSARSEINYRATLDMITVRLSSFHGISADGEHGRREISVDPEPHTVGLQAHEAEDAPNNRDLGSLTV